MSVCVRRSSQFGSGGNDDTDLIILVAVTQTFCDRIYSDAAAICGYTEYYSDTVIVMRFRILIQIFASITSNPNNC